jgi:hypothetical protein
LFGMEKCVTAENVWRDNEDIGIYWYNKNIYI